MGVQGLSTQLRPYASSFTLDKNEGTATNVDSFSDESIGLIIDGPSLAYYVYHRCIAACADRGRGFGDLPTYAELGRTTIALLEELESYGFHVDRCFFDGQLPETKIVTRLERLRKSLLQLNLFRSSCNALDSIAYGSQAKEPNEHDRALTRGRAPTRLSSLPTLPFLVPAIIESLQNSQKYGRLTKTVPGEADAFCKLRSDELSHRAILTNDSDLILLHPHCKVFFFNDLELRLGGATLRGLFYLPCTISEQLDCPNLMKLGYQVASNPGMTLRQCAVQVKELNVSDQDESYQIFAKAYCSEDTCSSNLERGIQDVLQRLDPRISEYILSCFSDVLDQTDTRLLYLPPLVDDAQRASAWRLSHPIRILAYSITALARPNLGNEMKETDRRGHRITEVEFQLYGPIAITNGLNDVIGAFGGLKEVSDVAEWRLAAFCELLRLLWSESSNLPAAEDVRKLLYGPPGPISWQLLHLHAQMDGLLYSFRILSQVLTIYTSLHTVTSRTEGFDQTSGRVKAGISSTIDQAALNEVQALLRRLPPLLSMHTRPGESFATNARLDVLSERLAGFYPTLMVEEHRQKTSREQKRQRKKFKRKSKEHKAIMSKRIVARNTSSNTFDLLKEA